MSDLSILWGCFLFRRQQSIATAKNNPRMARQPMTIPTMMPVVISLSLSLSAAAVAGGEEAGVEVDELCVADALVLDALITAAALRLI